MYYFEIILRIIFSIYFNLGENDGIFLKIDFINHFITKYNELLHELSRVRGEIGQPLNLMINFSLRSKNRRALILPIYDQPFVTRRKYEFQSPERKRSKAAGQIDSVCTMKGTLVPVGFSICRHER